MAEFSQGTHALWNHFDDLGLLIGLRRFPGERNREFRDRILRVYQNPGNATHQGMVNSISRDLGYPTYNVVDRRIFLLTRIPRLAGVVDVLVDGTQRRPQLIESFPLPSGWPAPASVTPSGQIVFGVAPSGWILWRGADGEYSSVLEFTHAPDTGADVAITYEVSVDEIIHRRTDQDFTRLETDPIYDVEGRFQGFHPASGVIEVHALSDPTFRDNPTNGLKDSAGRATDLLETIAQLINQAGPVLWDEFLWDEAVWDAADKEITGEEAIPVLLDADTSGFLQG